MFKHESEAADGVLSSDANTKATPRMHADTQDT